MRGYTNHAINVENVEEYTDADDLAKDALNDSGRNHVVDFLEQSYRSNKNLK
jgi:hypothetical protein